MPLIIAAYFFSPLHQVFPRITSFVHLVSVDSSISPNLFFLFCFGVNKSVNMNLNVKIKTHHWGRKLITSLANQERQSVAESNLQHEVFPSPRQRDIHSPTAALKWNKGRLSRGSPSAPSSGLTFYERLISSLSDLISIFQHFSNIFQLLVYYFLRRSMPFFFPFILVSEEASGTKKWACRKAHNSLLQTKK